MRTRNESIQFRVPASAKHVCMVRKAIRSVAVSLGFPPDTAEDIEVSVAEALANAIEHGSPEQGDNDVVATCTIEDHALVIDVRDEGSGFVPPKTPGSALWAEGGRGLQLIYELMDDVKVRRTRKGARIRMVKEKQPILDRRPQTTDQRL
ncbi:MAG: ATP-binding protein [Armatimonadota bacterium]